MNTKLYTLRIYFSNGTVWTQTGVAYASIAEVKHVWDVVSPHLHEESTAQAIPYQRGA